MFKRIAALILLGMGLVPAVASAQEAAPPTTTPPAAPVTAPAPSQQPTGLGTDGAMDLLASACFNGTMQACDDLYVQSPDGSAYQTYGDTCAGRQPAGTGRYCTTVFTDAVVQQPATTTTPPPAVAGTVTATMAAIHTICKPQALAEYAADYATKVPPASQGVVAEAAQEEGMTVDAALAAVLDSSLDSETQITVTNPNKPAQSPVGEATLSEWGLLIGRYLTCVWNTTQIPQDVLDNFGALAEGSGTWAGYTMTWGDTAEGDLTITITSAGAGPAPAAPTTVPAAPTTVPAAPTTVPAAPTTVPAAPTTVPAAPTTVPVQPAPAAGMAAAHAVCAEDAFQQYFIQHDQEVPVSEHGVFLAAAQAEGKTIEQKITDTLAMTLQSPKQVNVVDPWTSVAEEDKTTELGLLMGLMSDCMLNELAISDEAADQFLQDTNPTGSVSWANYTMQWQVTDDQFVLAFIQS